MVIEEHESVIYLCLMQILLGTSRNEIGQCFVVEYIISVNLLTTDIILF